MAKHAKRYAKSPINVRKKERRKRKSNNNKIQNILLIIFIIIFFVSGFILLKWFLDTNKSEDTYKELAQEVVSVNEENADENTIDFEKLKSINPDVVAWIKIDGTTINYPVMKTTDNNYYLKKNFYKEYDACGSLFLDYKSNLTDKNIVIYGHNIKRGIMFADLENIANGKLGNNINIELYMPDRKMNFKVFSSYSIDPEDYAINTSITENELDEFKTTLKERSSMDFESEYDNTNQVLTLSTCDRTGKKRVLVHAGLEEIRYNQ